MMREFWEQRYGEDALAYGEQPNVFLTGQTRYLQPGMRVLAVGDGQGRNGVWLAQHGLDVLSVDYAQTGLDRARALAEMRGVSIATFCVDLFTWDWPREQFDAVVAIFVHFSPEQRARMHQSMLAACKPGGVVIMEAFRLEQLEYQQRYHSGGPPAAALLYAQDMLAQDFREAEMLMLEDAETELSEGPYHSGKAAVVRLLARRMG